VQQLKNYQQKAAVMQLCSCRPQVLPFCSGVEASMRRKTLLLVLAAAAMVVGGIAVWPRMAVSTQMQARGYS
jgi:hypothetical protein